MPVKNIALFLDQAEAEWLALTLDRYAHGLTKLGDRDRISTWHLELAGRIERCIEVMKTLNQSE